jgi:hypothetical protein
MNDADTTHFLITRDPNQHAIRGVLEAIVGGPIGAALGAGAGGWLGHEVEQDTREHE